MSRSYIFVEASTTQAELGQWLENRPEWVILSEGRDLCGVWPGAVFKAVSGTKKDTNAKDINAKDMNDAALQLPAEVPPFATVPLHATLGEALAQLDKSSADVALVCAATGPQRHQMHGVISRQQIESGVRYRS
jgi:hypothetical protein